MAGVIAHKKAIVSSANARVLVTLISVPRFLTAMDRFSLQMIMLAHLDENSSDGDHTPLVVTAKRAKSVSGVVLNLWSAALLGRWQ
jgi:hypothetical protein